MNTYTLKPETAINMADVYNDIISIQIKSTDSFNTIMDNFYGIMRMHGIKQGTWTEGGGRLCNNAEWNMAIQTLKAHIDWCASLWMDLQSPPDDLLAYGESPR